MRAAFAAVLCLTLLIASAPLTHADDEGYDQEDAREAVETRQAIPLAEILSRTELQGFGEIVSVRLLREGQRWTYLLRFVDVLGKVRDVKADAGRVGESHPHGGD